MNKDTIKNIIFGGIIILILGVIVFEIMTTQPKSGEAWTTLYFTNYSNIQHELEVGEPFFVNFTIENYEKEDSNYSYVISLLYRQKDTIIKTQNMSSGSIFIKDKENVSISRKLVVNESYEGKIKVKVSVYKGSDSPYRDIHYLVKGIKE